MKTSIKALALLFTVTTVVTLAARLPLALVMLVANVPIEAERVSGTVWNGKIQNAWVQGYPIGDIAVSGRAMPLLTGKGGADLRFSGGMLRGQAGVVVGGSSVAIDDADLIVDLEALNLRDAFGAPMAGLIEAKIPSLKVADGRCEGGTIEVATDTLQRSAVSYGGEGFLLTGTGECTDGALDLPLAGDGPEASATIAIRVAREGYMTVLTIDPKTSDLEQALDAFGFEQVGSTYQLIQRGDIPA